MKPLMAGLVVATGLMAADRSAADKDPFLWLEEIQGENALKWVEKQNKHTQGILEKDERFQNLLERALTDYNASDKIPYGTLEGGVVINFWQDETHVRGVLRQTTLDSYTRDRPEWTLLLDLDVLALNEGENWVYKGCEILTPNEPHCLIRLSRGGGDAVVVREFDREKRQFVEHGFVSPESKQWVSWVNRDTLLIATDFGITADGRSSMNQSGYPRQVRLWRRGTPLREAQLVLDSDPEIVFNFPMVSHRPDGRYVGVVQGKDFFTQILYLMIDGALRKLELPLDIDFKGFFEDRIILQMRKDWAVGDQTAAAGALVSLKVPDVINGTPTDNLETLFEPSERSSIDEVALGKEAIYLSVLEDVTGKLLLAERDPNGWAITEVELPIHGSLGITSADEWSNHALVNYENFLQPSTLYLLTEDKAPQAVKSLPSRFDSQGMTTEQHFAVSKDGSKVPYFVIRKADLIMDGQAPAILYGYGGFEISLVPRYLTGLPKLWMEQGGVYVIANIRGGGEFGPKWHQAALKGNRQRAYDDFIAVGEDLIRQKISSPRRLGIRGGSNGGLLMGVMLTQRPDLWNAVVCGVPLLDMLRFHKLLAGASWVGEYGDPDIPEEREFILSYSPYQKLDPDIPYPEVLFFTSTRDDRVHPGHARKMAAKMESMGKSMLYYENMEGGHSAAANLRQRAYTDALQTVFALRKLKD